MVKKKSCFIATPIGDVNSDARRLSDGLIETVFRPVLESLDLKVTVAHQLSESGSITNQVISHLLDDELVVANLTDLNANVMYELAVRHAVRRPTVIVAAKDTRLPFDVISERTLFFSDEIAGVRSFTSDFERAARSALEDGKPDNPIYRVRTNAVLQEVVAGETDAVVLSRLEALERAVNRLAREQAVRLPSGSSSDIWFEVIVDGDDWREHVERAANELSRALDLEVRYHQLDDQGRFGVHVVRPGDLITREQVEGLAERTGLIVIR